LKRTRTFCYHGFSLSRSKPQESIVKKRPSYYHAAAAEPLVEATLGQILRRSALRTPTREALISVQQGIRWNFADLDRQVDMAAKSLLAMGIERGDNVAAWSTGRAEWVILQFACARIGAVLVTLNPAYRTAELEFALKLSEARALFLIERFKTSDYLAIFREVCPEVAKAEGKVITSTNLFFLNRAVFLGERDLPGMLSWPAFMDMGKTVTDAALHAAETPVSFDDPAVLMFTSGTTGSPKGVILTQHAVVNNAYISARLMDYRPGDRSCLCQPLFHIFGYWCSLMAVGQGGTVILPAEYFDAAATLKAVEAEKCTHLFGVPTMFAAELDNADLTKYDLSSLSGGLMAGAPCPPETLRAVMGKMHLPDMLVALGLTESAGSCTSTRITDTTEQRLNSVGLPLPQVEAKVIDPQTGETVPRGQTGELCLRGFLVMKEYYKNPEATAAQIDGNRWLHTGDLVSMDADGHLRMTGRLKDMVIRGGENIYPVEIENFLLTHPAVSQVAIVGVPDPRLGEELCAWIKLKDGATATADELRTFCQGRISHYKIPRYWKFVADYPLTASGKIRKVDMRASSAREFGLKA
jgi:fatty-acyl-CoA synthase